MAMTISTRHDEGRLAAAIYRQQVAQADALCDDMAQKFWPMIGTANQTAFYAMDDAVEAMTEAGMMRQQVKVKHCHIHIRLDIV